FVTILIEVIERTANWNNETLSLHCSLYPILITTIPFDILLPFFLIDITDILDKQHSQYVVFILGGVDYTTECITGIPHGFLNVLTFYHSLSINNFYISIVYFYFSLTPNKMFWYNSSFFASNRLVILFSILNSLSISIIRF